jgi:branched-subunit amino acid ABC-type transport system permease component
VTNGDTCKVITAFVPGILRARLISVSAEKLVTVMMGVLFSLQWFGSSEGRSWGSKCRQFQDVEGAALQGISVHRISALACVLACGLAAVAGCLMGAIFNQSVHGGTCC